MHTARQKSVAEIPGLVADEHGNINIVGVDVDKTGLRPYYEFLMNCPPKHLQGVVLSEMLDWCRWGSQTGVMWEASLPELITLVERWERANGITDLIADTERTLYEENPEEAVPAYESWQEIVAQMLMAQRGPLKWLCPNGHVTSESMLSFFENCPECGKDRADCKLVPVGPRGLSTYNLCLEGGGGEELATAFYATRPYIKRYEWHDQTIRVVPEHLR